MSTHRVTKNLLVGLPESGKSTFIAALWEVIRSFVVPGALHFVSLDGDDEYLNQIHQAWLRGEPMERTKVKSAIPVSIKLRNTTSKNEEVTELILPDLDGELIKRQWTRGEITLDYDTHLQEAAGVLFFVSARNLREGNILDPANEELADVIGKAREERDNNETAPKKKVEPLPFDPEKVPTQTMLIQLLQFILRRSQIRKRWRIALIISAWDVVEEGRVTHSPEHWLREKLPLLSQFLQANVEHFECQIYGISAQGGELKDEGKKKELARFARHSERIIVIDGSKRNHDITAPIKWLMSNG